MDDRTIPASLEDFLGTTVHELNNFSFALSGFTELLQMEAIADETVRDYLHEISETNARLAQFNNKIAALAGRLSVDLTTISIVELVSLLKNISQFHIEVKEESEQDKVIAIDSLMFNDAIKEIIHFALSCQAQTILKMNLTKVNLNLAFQLSMEAKVFDARKIFKPFYSSRELFNEKGLGLSWLPGYFNALQGNISFHSHKNLHSFHIELPLKTPSEI